MFRPLAVFPSPLSLSVSVLFSSTPHPHFHCHICLVCLFRPYLPVRFFLCLFVFLSPLSSHPLHTSCSLG